MATILLQAAGAALGGIFGPVGAVIGRAAGALAGAAIDRSLIGGETRRGPRLDGGRIPSAEEGTGITRLYGTARLAGTLIWATRFEETVTSERHGAKGGGPRTETYSYFGNFAIGLCEGPIAGVRRIWADGQELDLTEIEFRVYRGTADQLPDPLIEAKQGADETPAYRGLAYVVFERLPLDRFGNRIPMLQFEVARPVGMLERELRAITIIPGATEHGYQPVPVSETPGAGEARFLNRHVAHGPSDWTAAIDELQALCPKLETVALVCAWFGSDLRAGSCLIDPRVEVGLRPDESMVWSVGGIGRGEALLVSRRDGSSAYGGTPSDASVVAAISDLKARGLKVFLYPFVLLDVPPGNALPDPEGGNEQPAYPWRGRITCHPAPGRAGTADRTAEARAQVEAFCGPAEASDFSRGNGTVAYLGADSGYRRFILHYAHLAAEAGGVDGFILGSEMRGLTRVRDEAGAFPFVDELARLANDVRAVVGPEAALTYAADWSEYFGYQPADGSGDVFFNLDTLWMAEAIDAVGIDNYMPLADWRDRDFAEGNPDGFATPTDTAALRGQIAGGEGHDWYYASAADRAARLRTPITDGAANKSWVFRYKDLAGWWGNAHFERVGGVERAAPTVWQPGAKPIWFTELGCPAVDKGANQPNVFPDPKSSEGQIPYFSNGARSDLMQRRFIEAHLGHWTEGSGAMVDPGHIFAWTWDARPYPAFPADGAAWADGGNWRTGHWLNGRLGTAAAADIVTAAMRDHGFADVVCEDLGADIVGYVQSEPMSARALLEPLLDLVQADAFESGGTIRVRSRTRRAEAPLVLDVLAEPDEGADIELVRAQTAELSGEAVIDHIDPATAYGRATARSRRLEAGSERIGRLALPAVIGEEAAVGEAEHWLRDHWAAREAASFTLSPAMLGLEPGDLVALSGAKTGRLMVKRIEDGASRRVEARGVASGAVQPSSVPALRSPALPVTVDAWAPIAELLDLPILEGADEANWLRAAVFSRPFRPAVLSASAGQEGYAESARIDRPARMGELLAPLAPGFAGRFDRAGRIECRLYFGGLSSAEEAAVLNGTNVIAVRSAAGGWEIVQFLSAEEVSAGIWRLAGLLRGQAGSEDQMAAGADAGARVVVLGGAVVPVTLRPFEVGLPLNWRLAAGQDVRTVAQGFQGGLRALTPLSPVHLTASRTAAGDVEFGWIRRGRFDADSWLGPDIPLDFDEERYRVEIGDGETALRTIDVTEPRYTLAGADEVALFGSKQAEIRLTVRQFGSRVPLGMPAGATLSV